MKFSEFDEMMNSDIAMIKFCESHGLKVAIVFFESKVSDSKQVKKKEDKLGGSP